MEREIRMRRILIVSWGDAFIDPEDFEIEDAESTKPVYRKTVGFLIAKNQYGYVLATDTYDEEPEVAGKLFIPHGMVTGVEEVFTRVKKENNNVGQDYINTDRTDSRSGTGIPVREASPQD